MSAELWLGVGHFLLGVLIIFALLVALMETSRKFDRFHDNSYLLLASGYFMLVVWALIWSMALAPSILQLTGTVFQIVGWICLAFGYYFHHQSHPGDDDAALMPVSAQQPNVQINPSLKTVKNDWTAMAAAQYESVEPEASNDAVANSENSAEPEIKEFKTISQPDPAPEIANAKVTDSTEPVVSPTASHAPTAVTPPTPTIKKKTTFEEADLSYLAKKRKPKAKLSEPTVFESVTPEQSAKGKPKSIVTPASKPAVKLTPQQSEQQREQMMDELFPLADPNQPKALSPDATDLLPSERKQHQAKLPAVIFGVSSVQFVQIWPEIIMLITLIWVIVALLPQRHQRGNGWLMSGFAVIGLGTIGAILYSPQLLGPLLTYDAQGLSTFGVGLVQTIGFALIGVGSWQKIKGKVTHHFIKIVSLIYILLLVLTIGLAIVIAKDLVSLQLLLLMITGVLITILPIIHSLTYSHPHQPQNDIQAP